jgi:hypothetical protein
MAAKAKIPFSSHRHDKDHGGKFEINTKKSSSNNNNSAKKKNDPDCIDDALLAPPWADDGSWADYKSNSSSLELEPRKSTKPATVSRRQSAPNTSTTAAYTSGNNSNNNNNMDVSFNFFLKPLLFPYLNKEDSTRDMGATPINETSIQLSTKRKPSTTAVSITSGLMHNLSMSTFGNSFSEAISPIPGRRSPGRTGYQSPVPGNTGYRSPGYRSAPPRSASTPELKYTTLMFTQGKVMTKSTVVHTESKVEAGLGPVGEFYLSKKLSKSITLPTISRGSLQSAGLAGVAATMQANDMKSLSTGTKDGNDGSIATDNNYNPDNGKVSNMNDDLDEEAQAAAAAAELTNEIVVVPVSGQVSREVSARISARGQDLDNDGVLSSSVSSSSRAPGQDSPTARIPPLQPVPYQIHNRVLGSKLLLPESSAKERREHQFHQIISTARSQKTDLPAPVPFQVHKRIMGWKLTSINRRKELIALLDIVNSKDDGNGLRLRQELERQGILSDYQFGSAPGTGLAAAPHEQEDSAETIARKKKTARRIAASWERAVGRLVKARVGVLDGKAEYQKHKEQRDARREQRRLEQGLLTPELEEDDEFDGFHSFLFDDEDDGDEFEFIPEEDRPSKMVSPTAKRFSPLARGDNNRIDSPNARSLNKQEEDNVIERTSSSSPQPVRANAAVLNAHIRALSPKLKKQVETYTSTADLLVLNDRMVSNYCVVWHFPFSKVVVQDILKSAEMMRRSMNPPSPREHSAEPYPLSKSHSPAYYASFLDPQHRSDSPPKLRLATVPHQILSMFDDSPLFSEDEVARNRFSALNNNVPTTEADNPNIDPPS